MDDEKLGIRLKKAREKAGLTQQEVCDKCGISKVQVLSNYERGVNSPRIDAIKLLCELYDISADSLLFGEDRFSAKKKTLQEYARQLVEAVDFLGIEVDADNDGYGNQCIFSVFSGTKYKDFNAFSHKWRGFRELLDEGHIEQDEYKMLLFARLNELEMKEVQPEPMTQSWDETKFPF